MIEDRGSYQILINKIKQKFLHQSCPLSVRASTFAIHPYPWNILTLHHTITWTHHAAVIFLENYLVAPLCLMIVDGC